MRPLPRVTFVLDMFDTPSPGQQLLDRFLVGYNSDGRFHTPGCEVALLTPNVEPFRSRIRDFGLNVVPDLSGAHSVVFAGESRPFADLPSGSRCFVYGLVDSNPERAAEVVRVSERRGIVLTTGTEIETAFRLPQVEVAEAAIRRALIVTTGPRPGLDAVHALRSIAPSRSAFQQVKTLFWRDVWEMVYSREWQPLFASAISRSNTIQGDPEKDGRTQDVVGLRLVEKLVKEARAWMVTHSDGMQTAIVDLHGALLDINFAVELSTGEIVSAQLYCPPPPMQDHFSPLAERIERFFRVDVAPAAPDLTILPALFARLTA